LENHQEKKKRHIRTVSILWNLSDDLLVEKKGPKREVGKPVGGAGEDFASRGGSSASAI
jgi:hypothetical protein